MTVTPFTWPWPLYKRPFNGVLWNIARLNHVLTGVPIRRFCHIMPNLFVGGKISRAGWERLESWGVSVLINLRVEFDDLSLGIRPQTYMWLPTIDGTPPTLGQMLEGVRAIQRADADGHKVYVHCAAGVGRAPTLAAAYLVTTGLSPRQAIDFIQRRRPFIFIWQGRWQKRRVGQFADYWAAHAGG
jgi:hypothetical protein